MLGRGALVGIALTLPLMASATRRSNQITVHTPRMAVIPGQFFSLFFVMALFKNSVADCVSGTVVTQSCDRLMGWASGSLPAQVTVYLPFRPMNTARWDYE